ncbi:MULTISPECIES: hypothetical protein [unclassified Campylobacter]|uniref:hypothetical protein n=1 Tax=unclassified Campylobacter TaxID=2593542 RepID=UPI003D335A33
MKKFIVFCIFGLVLVGCGAGRSSIPLNKGAFTQKNEYSITEFLNSEYAKKNIKNLDKVGLEFGSNEQNKTIIRADVKVQKYVTAYGTENIKEACAEALVAIIDRYVREAVKRNGDVVNISSNWRGVVEPLNDDKYICMSSKSSVGIMIKADIAQK